MIHKLEQRHVKRGPASERASRHGEKPGARAYTWCTLTTHHVPVCGGWCCTRQRSATNRATVVRDGRCQQRVDTAARTGNVDDAATRVRSVVQRRQGTWLHAHVMPTTAVVALARRRMLRRRRRRAAPPEYVIGRCAGRQRVVLRGNRPALVVWRMVHTRGCTAGLPILTARAGIATHARFIGVRRADGANAEGWVGHVAGTAASGSSCCRSTARGRRLVQLLVLSWRRAIAGLGWRPTPR